MPPRNAHTPTLRHPDEMLIGFDSALESTAHDLDGYDSVQREEILAVTGDDRGRDVFLPED